MPTGVSGHSGSFDRFSQALQRVIKVDLSGLVYGADSGHARRLLAVPRPRPAQRVNNRFTSRVRPNEQRGEISGLSEFRVFVLVALAPITASAYAPSELFRRFPGRSRLTPDFTTHVANPRTDSRRRSAATELPSSNSTDRTRPLVRLPHLRVGHW